MKKIQRQRYAIVMPETNEILCGLARNYEFKKIDNLGDTALKTYRTEKQAIAGFIRSWFHAEEWLKSGRAKVVKVLETIEFLGEIK